ncbi:MAG: MBL fold metallo-hydrolase [Sedimentisphaerales bacterium]|nr:MBL fold metallo-hydrolase [Sedimentisphaerales bacterium]
MANRNLTRLTLDKTELLGYSVGGEETVVAIPTLNVCFDIGKAPEELLTVDNVLLTHGHMDHAAGIAYYFSQRNFREMAPGRLLLPARLAPAIEQLLECWGHLDGTTPPARIIPMEHGQEYEVRRNLFVFAFATNHCDDSLGYTVIERRQKLKDEYYELPGAQIAKLRKEGVQVTYTLNLPLVTYLGDTMSGDFENLACVRQSRILIAECTFFEQDHHGRAQAGRHYHFDQLAELLPKLDNEYIVLTHLSRRTDIRSAIKMVQERLPEDISRRVKFLMERPRRFRQPNKEEAAQNSTQ